MAALGARVKRLGVTEAAGLASPFRLGAASLLRRTGRQMALADDELLLVLDLLYVYAATVFSTLPEA